MQHITILCEHGTHKHIFKEKEIEVHYCDLTEDNVFGWCEQCDDNSLVSYYTQ